MILRLVRPGHVAKQLQVSIGRTVSDSSGWPTDFKIHYTLRTGNVQDAPKTPLVKGINSLLCGFGYGPRLGIVAYRILETVPILTSFLKHYCFQIIVYSAREEIFLSMHNKN